MHWVGTRQQGHRTTFDGGRRGAGGEQAEVEGHEGMHVVQKWVGCRAWWTDQQATPCWEVRGARHHCRHGTQVSEKVSTAVQFKQRTSVDVTTKHTY